MCHVAAYTGCKWAKGRLQVGKRRKWQGRSTARVLTASHDAVGAVREVDRPHDVLVRELM